MNSRCDRSPGFMPRARGARGERAFTDSSRLQVAFHLLELFAADLAACISFREDFKRVLAGGRTAHQPFDEDNDSNNYEYPEQSHTGHPQPHPAPAHAFKSAAHRQPPLQKSAILPIGAALRAHRIIAHHSGVAVLEHVAVIREKTHIAAEGREDLDPLAGEHEHRVLESRVENALPKP